MVKRGQVMGTSGQTGMAGGDHIHFGMQLDGVQIDPKEWWDSHWINDHIAKRVDLPGFNSEAGIPCSFDSRETWSCCSRPRMDQVTDWNFSNDHLKIMRWIEPRTSALSVSSNRKLCGC